MLTQEQQKHLDACFATREESQNARERKARLLAMREAGKLFATTLALNADMEDGPEFETMIWDVCQVIRKASNTLISNSLKKGNQRSVPDSFESFPVIFRDLVNPRNNVSTSIDKIVWEHDVPSIPTDPYWPTSKRGKATFSMNDKSYGRLYEYLQSVETRKRGTAIYKFIVHFTQTNSKMYGCEVEAFTLHADGFSIKTLTVVYEEAARV